MLPLLTRLLTHLLPARLRKRRAARHLTDATQRLAAAFEILNRFRGAGLLYFDFRHKMVTIDQWLAMHYIDDEHDWDQFLHNLHLWARYMYSVNEYQKLFNRVRADAEAAAYRADPAITADGRQLARLRAAAQLDEDEARRQIEIPDIQFVVLGAADGKPIIVAKSINGRFVTTPVPDNDKEE